MKALLIMLLGCAFSLHADEVLTRDERIIALTLLGEARGEGKRGLFAVGCVIQRRSWEREMTPAKICLQDKQFDTWTGKKERDLWHLWDSKEMMNARHLARCLNKDNIILMDITNGANHFCTIKSNPHWAKGKKPTKIIGNHKFYKLP